MKFRKSKVALALGFGVGGGMLVAAFGAGAQDAPVQVAQQADIRVEVTGSNIKRVEGEGALPVTVINAQEIDRTGATNAMELLKLVSANNSAGNVSLGNVIGATTFSAQTASLRGLQGGRTLVLINGKRVNGFARRDPGRAGREPRDDPVHRDRARRDPEGRRLGRVRLRRDRAASSTSSCARTTAAPKATVYYGTPTRSGGGDAGDRQRLGRLRRPRQGPLQRLLSLAYDHQKPLDAARPQFLEARRTARHRV